LLTIEMKSSFAKAAQSDLIADTVDYFAVSQKLFEVWRRQKLKLIEKLAADIAEMILSDFQQRKSRRN